MLTQPLIQQLQQLRLRGMADALEQQVSNSQRTALSFEERLGIMIQHEITERASARLTQRLRWARLPQGAVLEDLNTAAMRGLDPAALAQVRDLAWIGEHLNVLITGPTGVGKSFLACALAHAACRADYAVRFFRLPRLVDELTRLHALHNRSSFLKQLAKVDLLLIDDFGQLHWPSRPSVTCSKSSMIATTGDRPSSPASCRLISGTRFWLTRL